MGWAFVELVVLGATLPKVALFSACPDGISSAQMVISVLAHIQRKQLWCIWVLLGNRDVATSLVFRSYFAGPAAVGCLLLGVAAAALVLSRLQLSVQVMQISFAAVCVRAAVCLQLCGAVAAHVVCTAVAVSLAKVLAYSAVIFSLLQFPISCVASACFATAVGLTVADFHTGCAAVIFGSVCMQFFGLCSLVWVQQRFCAVAVFVQLPAWLPAAMVSVIVRWLCSGCAVAFWVLLVVVVLFFLLV
ncbi:hypothetical protein U1Q18_009339 [Sarracenia purpurea var. burkii]